MIHILNDTHEQDLSEFQMEYKYKYKVNFNFPIYQPWQEENRRVISECCISQGSRLAGCSGCHRMPAYSGEFLCLRTLGLKNTLIYDNDDDRQTDRQNNLTDC